MTGFSEGLIQFPEPIGPAKSLDYKWGYLDKSGRAVIAAKYKFAQSFHDGLAAVLLDNKIGYIDHSGQFIIKPQFDESYNDSHNFHEGRAAVVVNDLCGLIDKSGKFIVEPKYEFIAPFSEHLAAFKPHEKSYGYLDLDGKVAIQPQFLEAGQFSEGMAAVNFHAGPGIIGNGDLLIIQAK